MNNWLLTISIGLSMHVFAEDQQDVGVVITNYTYDEYGRAIPHSEVVPNSYYRNNPSNYNTYYPTTTNLPGLDPDRQEDIFEKNRRL